MLLVEADKESQDRLMLLDVHRVSSPSAKASVLYFPNHTSPVYRTDEASSPTSLRSLPNALVFGKGAGFTLLSRVIVHPPAAMGKSRSLNVGQITAAGAGFRKTAGNELKLGAHVANACWGTCEP